MFMKEKFLLFRLRRIARLAKKTDKLIAKEVKRAKKAAV